MQSFVDRVFSIFFFFLFFSFIVQKKKKKFRYNASRAKMAQSRLKAIQRMEKLPELSLVFVSF